jgi:lipoprotein NlpD
MCALLLAGCAATPPRAPEGYIVKPQDTLYGIAWRFGLDYRALAQWNGIGADYRVWPGQRLRLRPAGGSAGRGHAAAGNATGGASGPAKAPSDATPGNPAHAADRGGAGTGTFNWVWPTDAVGKVRAVPGGGLLLYGRLGQEVRAAAPGRVVYTGNGLRSYGELVIIRHGESMLSAYAHNRELLVHEGQDVTAGQAIAHMGEAVHQTAALYFEIRVNGRPVDPLPYLPTARNK